MSKLSLDDQHAAMVAWARRLLRSQMTLKGMSYRQLEMALRKIGVIDSEVNLRNKINRGMFPAFFFLQCLNAMEIRNLEVPSWAGFIKEYEEWRAMTPKLVKVPGGYLRYDYDPENEKEPVFVRTSNAKPGGEMES